MLCAHARTLLQGQRDDTHLRADGGTIDHTSPPSFFALWHTSPACLEGSANEEEPGTPTLSCKLDWRQPADRSRSQRPGKYDPLSISTIRPRRRGPFSRPWIEATPIRTQRNNVPAAQNTSYNEHEPREQRDRSRKPPSSHVRSSMRCRGETSNGSLVRWHRPRRGHPGTRETSSLRRADARTTGSDEHVSLGSFPCVAVGVPGA